MMKSDKKGESIFPKNSVYGRMRTVLPLMFVVLVLVIIAAVSIGAVYIPFGKAVEIILANLGLLKSSSFSQEQNSIIFMVRLPRVLAASLVGSALAACGTVMQSMFRNPMADPGVLGVSSGAGLGAVTAITLGFSS